MTEGALAKAIERIRKARKGRPGYRLIHVVSATVGPRVAPTIIFFDN
jgi:hypothetical protein